MSYMIETLGIGLIVPAFVGLVFSARVPRLRATSHVRPPFGGVARAVSLLWCRLVGNTRKPYQPKLPASFWRQIGVM